MNRFEIDLIKQAFENYQKTGNATGTTFSRNGDEFFYYSSALDSLIEQGYATPTSDHYDSDHIDLSAPRISYELTDEGLTYAQANLAH